MARLGNRTARATSSVRGLTLIEITIALAIAAMVAALALASMNSLTHASLKSASIEIQGAIKFCYDRSIMEKRIERIGMDLDKGIWWIDYTTDPYALSAERMTGSEGEKSGSEKTDEDEDTDSFFDDEDKEVKRALEGGLGARFVPDEQSGKASALPSGIRFSKVWTGHQEEPFTTGVAYLHFFRSGWTEPAHIELTDDDDYITLKVSPLTGRVRRYNEQLETPDVEEYDGRKEGDE